MELPFNLHFIVWVPDTVHPVFKDEITKSKEDCMVVFTAHSGKIDSVASEITVSSKPPAQALQMS